MLAFHSAIDVYHSLTVFLALHQQSTELTQASHLICKKHRRINVQEFNEKTKYSWNFLSLDFVEQIEFKERQSFPHFTVVDLYLLLIYVHFRLILIFLAIGDKIFDFVQFKLIGDLFQLLFFATKLFGFFLR